MRCQFIFTVGLFVLLTSGCFVHSGYPYGYYGPGPGVVPQQPMNAYPTTPAYPTYTPGVPSFPTPLNGDPGSTPPTSPPINTYGNGTNGSNDSAPPFDPNAPSGGRIVPPPGDDDGSGSTRGGTTQRPALQPTQATSATESEESTPFTQKESRRSRPSEDGDSLVDADDQFHPPVVQQTSATNDADMDVVGGASNSSTPKQKPFAHDAKFAWVQGTVEFDKPTRTWAIMFDDNPPESDQLGGYLVLADDPQLGRLRTGDTVRLYGSLDDSIVDSRNQPIFRVTRLKRL